MKKRNFKQSDEVKVRELIGIIVEAIKEKKGKNIIKIDLSNIKNTLCDCFIICEGDSSTQVNALADNIERLVYILTNKEPHHVEGRENAQWILIDFFDVVVHVFQPQTREFYKLEELWADGVIEAVKEYN